MEKQVALIVTDDLTDLNKRLATGYRIYNQYTLGNGNNMFLLTKYVPNAVQEGAIAVSPVSLDSRVTGYSQLITRG